jgi:hypothetical protein
MWIWGVVEMYLALLAASAPALKPFFRRFLVEPLGTIAGSSSRDKQAKYDKDAKGRGWSGKDSSVRHSAAIHDPERIGVAYGGSDLTKSREESFVREIDDDDMETRRFEMRHSRDGKIVPMQVWRKTTTPDRERMPSIHRTYDNPPPQPQAHVRNFSQPHSYSSSDATTAPILKPQRRISQGSVKAGRLAAQHSISQAERNIAPKRRPPAAAHHDQNGGRGSRLDPPSDSDSGSDYYGSHEKPPETNVHDSSRASRSTSEETLRLPRMGSQSFDKERGTKWGWNIGHGR